MKIKLSVDKKAWLGLKNWHRGQPEFSVVEDTIENFLYSAKVIK